MMDYKATFKFYAVKDVPYVGAYKTGSFKKGEPVIMFAMDFHTWSLKDTPISELSNSFKDGMLQTITHEFCHAMQEMLDKEYDEYEVEKILGAYKKDWDVFSSPQEYEPEAVFAIDELLNWIDNVDYGSVEEFKDGIKNLFKAHILWAEAKKKAVK